MRILVLTTAVAIAVLAAWPAGRAEAHGPGPAYAGYGNGAHDYLPHWHQANTPFGPVYWYGNGLHDYLPHHHSASPWGGVQSYGVTPFGPTRSLNGFPPYGGAYYGGYAFPYGGYGPGFGGWGW